MKTCCNEREFKVFIASSKLMDRERQELVDLLTTELADIYEPAGIWMRPVKWEYMSESMGTCRKEDEYLERLRDCDLCLVLFDTTLGEYTLEELDVAVAEQRAGRNPRLVHVLFKSSSVPGSPEMQSFKDSFTGRYGAIASAYTGIADLRRQVAEIIKRMIIL